MSGAKPKTVRLDRLLANLGYGSRRQVQDMVRWGEVVLDGVAVRDASAHVPLASGLTDRMTVSGEPVDPPPPLTLVMHKPLGVVCSHKEPGRSIYDLLPERWRRREPALSTVGRLDADTTGLLLITDDGALLHRLISPRSKVEKRYLAELKRPLTGGEGELFASGTLMLEGDDKPLAPARFEPLSPRAAYLSVTEGRYHQVRRMFAATGNEVTALRRDRIGSLDAPSDLRPGDFRPVTSEELDAAMTPRDQTGEEA